MNSHKSVRTEAPFGGYKRSGLGRELGMHAMEHYTEVKNVYISTESYGVDTAPTSRHFPPRPRRAFSPPVPGCPLGSADVALALVIALAGVTGLVAMPGRRRARPTSRAASTLSWRRCGGGVECARLAVPLDDEARADARSTSRSSGYRHEILTAGSARSL